jgi:hypothetical protein
LPGRIIGQRQHVELAQACPVQTFQQHPSPSIRRRILKRTRQTFALVDTAP